ncbi:hypothetical protein D3C75_1343240 [compost metagenome]
MQKPLVSCQAVQLREKGERSQGIDHFYPFGLVLVPVHPLQQIINHLPLPGDCAIFQ